ncbi:MAG: M48 family metalloprotease [Bacteroidales bacterium]|nr:M48 family metalloprotease [Bacteroidales bacterium]
MKPPNLIKRIAFLLALCLLAVSCAINPVTGKTQLMLMSEAQEIQMGAQYDPQVIATFGEYKDEQILSFIQDKADEMGKISHRPNLKYHVKILDSPVVNAFAVPGGYIYLTRGILAQFNNEAELMGVLGHEMGHITARHSVSTQSKQTLGQLILIGGMIASEEFASYAQYALQGMQLLFLKFSRDNERQADQLGVAYSSQIGYDANKMADFFQVLKKMSMPEEQGGVPTFLSTHPDPADRYNSVKRDAQMWQDSLKMDIYKVNADNYMHMIDGIIYGEDPRQGYVEGNTFYHPEMKFRFSFPAGWQFENLPTQVNMAPSDGKALIVFTFAPGSSLDQAVSNSLQQLELKPYESLRTNINNLPAIVTMSKQVYQDQTTGQQQSNMIISCFIDYENTYFVFHGVTAEVNYNIYGDPFMATMNTFSRLTDPAKLNKMPVKILVKKVQRTGTLADALKYYGMQQDRMNELSFLNNLELTDVVQAGKLIKVIGY